MLEGLRAGLNKRLDQRRNRSFLEAIMAACALVAMADDELSFSESQKIDEVLEGLMRLRVFDVHEATDLFKDYVDLVEAGPASAQADLLRTVAKISDDEKAARLLVQVCIAVSRADGSVVSKETHQIAEICQVLRLQPSQFGL